jgi:hypothetical protein
VRLDYAAASGCPDAADFKAAVIARLGYDPFVGDAPDQVLVQIQGRDNAIDGRIEWRDSSGNWAGEQSFPSVSTDCFRLVRAMGFALAVQIQLLAKATAAAPEEAPAKPASPAEAPALLAPPSPAVPTQPKVADVATAAVGGPRPAFALGAGPSVGLGVSSEPLVLGRLFGALAWRHVSIELGAAASVPATTRRADGAGFSQQLLLASVAGCGTISRWSGCLVVNGGEVRMAGENIDRPTSATVFIAEAGVRAGVRQRLGRRAFVSARADGLVNLTRWTGSLDQVPVWTAPRFAAALGLDAGVQFP